MKEIQEIELKNTLLSEKLDYDYIDMLIRDKLMLGKKGDRFAGYSKYLLFKVD